MGVKRRLGAHSVCLSGLEHIGARSDILREMSHHSTKLLGLRWLSASAALGLACSPIPPSTRSPVPHPEVVAAEVPDVGAGAFQRLTQAQVENVVDTLLMVVPDDLPADTYPYLFATIGAATDTLSEQSVELLEQSLSNAAAEAFADEERRVGIVGCDPVADAGCAAAFVARFGRQAWRRPLAESEQARWVAVAEAAGGGWAGAEAVAAGMLQSPYTLYRIELGQPHPTRADWLQLTPHEVAQRMALLLWDGLPDAALGAAADDGSLLDPAVRRAHVVRMLDDPRAETATLRFFEQFLDLDRLSEARPDPAVYPEFTEGVRTAMRAEVLLLVDDVVHRRDTDVRALWSERRAYVNDALASHYGLDVDGVDAITYRPVELGEDSERAGILGLGAFLTMNARSVATSPTLRGKYVVERVLCAPVPPPPDDVDFAIIEAEDGSTSLRDRLEQHRDDPACSSCHEVMDPPGLLFEHFDATGRWRDTDNGQPIDSSGELSGVELSGSGDLGALLATHDAVGPCLTKQLYRHAHARLDEDADALAIADIAEAFSAAGHRYRGLLTALVVHDSFVAVARPDDGGAP